MGLPLAILALFAVFSGYLWLPEVVGGYAPFRLALAPVWQGSVVWLNAHAPGSHLALVAVHGDSAAAAEWINMGISAVVAIGVSVFAFLIYSKPEQLEKLSRLVSGEGGLRAAYRLLLHKYYVDEIYDAFIVRPTKLVAEILYVVVDLILINLLLVNGSAALVQATSQVARRAQSGVLRHYLYAFAAGAVVMMAIFLMSVQ